MDEESREYTPDPRLEEAEDLADEGQYDEALEQLDGLEPELADPEDRGTLLGLRLVCLRRLGRDRDARTLADDLFRDYRQEPDAIISAAIECSEHGDSETAEGILRRVHRLAPDSDAAHNLGVVLHDSGRYDEALEWFDEALKRDPGFAATHWLRAEALEALNRVEEAAASWRRYLLMEPQDAEGWVSLGIDESDIGHYDAAMEAFDTALQLEPDAPHAWYNRGVTASRAGQSLRLAECVETLHRIDPGGWRALITAARFATAHGDPGKVWDLCRDAVDAALLGTTEDDFGWVLPHVLQTVFGIAEEEGLVEERRELLERALDLGLYYEPVFDELRRDAGRLSPRARMFEVEIRGRVEDPELVEEMTDVEFYAEADYGYTVSYRVWSDDAEDAEARAIQFEANHGPGASLRIVKTTQLAAEPEEALCGVAWRGDMHVFPAQEEA